MSTTRIYAVTVRDNDTYLVDATSKQQAERHVAAKFISAEVANGKTVAELMANGVKVETAGDPDTGKLPGVE